MYSTFSLTHSCLFTAQNSYMFRLYYSHHQTGHRNEMEILQYCLFRSTIYLMVLRTQGDDCLYIYTYIYFMYYV